MMKSVRILHDSFRSLSLTIKIGLRSRRLRRLRHVQEVIVMSPCALLLYIFPLPFFPHESRNGTSYHTPPYRAGPKARGHSGRPQSYNTTRLANFMQHASGSTTHNSTKSYKIKLEIATNRHLWGGRYQLEMWLICTMS